jgi:hypothetical protein
MAKHAVQEHVAEKVWGWLRERGGLAIWASANLSDLSRTWTAPVNGADGLPLPKQSWAMQNEPCRIITDPAEVVVEVPREVKRFRVGVRLGAQGMQLKVTDGGTRRIRAAVAKAGDGAWYEFDYGAQEAVIYVAVSSVPIAVWAAARGLAKGGA